MSRLTVLPFESPLTSWLELQTCFLDLDSDHFFLRSKLNPKVRNPADPLHAASGNFAYLGGCGACGILSGNGVSKGYVITDVTDHLDSLDRSAGSSPPQGSHIDICLKEFQEYVPGTDGNHGGIFTGSWTR